MIALLLLLLLALFIVSFSSNDKKWFSPFYLFAAPLLFVVIFSSFFMEKWDFAMSLMTVCIIFIGVAAFLLGSKLVKRNQVVRTENTEFPIFQISNFRLFLVVAFETICFLLFLSEFLAFARTNNMTLSEAINEVMILMKFSQVDLIDTPFILAICLQLNYISGFIFAYLIARRLLLKERYSFLLLLIGFIIANLTCFLGGSRGPIIENLIALFLSFVFVYYKKTGKSFFKVGVCLALAALAVVAVPLFFSLPSLMGRKDSDANLLNEFVKYFGAQVYNLDYFVTNVDTRSGFFGANTLSAFLTDFRYLGCDISVIQKQKVGLFFVEANGNALGNVFTCFYDFYADGGIFGVILFSLAMGFISQMIFEKAFSNNRNELIWMSLYTIISVHLLFCFFGNRFYTNVFNLIFIFKIFWLIVINRFLVKPGKGKIVSQTLAINSQSI